jgi:hypothetical protein
MWNLYVIEKFSRAVRELALGEGNLKQRLVHACFGLMSINPEELPGLLRSEFRSLKEQVMGVEPTGEVTGCTETINTLNPNQVKQAVQTILKLHEEILKRDPLHEYHDRPKA